MQTSPPPANDPRDVLPGPAEEADRSLAGVGVCPRCNVPYAETQEYCLNCGLRLPGMAPPQRAPGRFAERLPWSAGEWIWPVALGFVIAALGAAAAIVFERDDDGSPIVATRPPRGTGTGVETVTPPTRPPTTQTTPRTTRRTDARRPGTSRPPKRPTRGLTSWPAGKSGHTIILASVPASVGRQIALAQARRARGAGLPDVGVLRSSEYTSLHPGYYVVFTGVYASNVQAENALPNAIASGFQDAYTTRVVP